MRAADCLRTQYRAGGNAGRITDTYRCRDPINDRANPITGGNSITHPAHANHGRALSSRRPGRPICCRA